jgi:putative ABC transport system permease protein
MLVSDILKETIFSILSNKFRSFLTILGIVIGIAAVILMMSIGQGAKSSIEKQVQTMGSNLLIVMPGAMKTFSPVAGARGGAQTLTYKDTEAISKEVSNIVSVSPVVYRNLQVIFKNKNTRTQIVGANSFFLDIRNYQLEKGTFFNKNQVDSMARVAVLGSVVRDDLFGSSTDPIGQSIKINGINFKVIGVLKPKGGMTALEDDIVVIPVTVVKRFFVGNDYVNAILIKANSPKDIDFIKSQVEDLLLKRHNIKSSQMADFSIVTQEDILQMVSSITQTMTILLTSIAAISLIVGGIGIMNMMMTNVTERTKEIGLRKAIGAKKSEIKIQFLSEAVALTFLGGLIGVILGWGLSLLVTKFTGLLTDVSLFSVFLAFGVSSLVGIVFGYWPALRAARLDPIEALRHE